MYVRSTDISYLICSTDVVFLSQSWNICPTKETEERFVHDAALALCSICFSFTAPPSVPSSPSCSPDAHNIKLVQCHHLFLACCHAVICSHLSSSFAPECFPFNRFAGFGHLSAPWMHSSSLKHYHCTQTLWNAAQLLWSYPASVIVLLSHSKNGSLSNLLACPCASSPPESSGVVIAVIIICILLLAILGSVLYFLYKKGKIGGRSGKQDLWVSLNVWGGISCFLWQHESWKKRSIEQNQ